MNLIVLRIFSISLFALAITSLGFGCKEPKAYHYKVHGTVVDEQGEPLPDVEVLVKGFDIQRVRSVEGLTDSNGRFSINFDINPFEWRQEAHWVIVLRHEGFIPRVVNYPEFTYDDRFRYQGYWYEVYFREPVTMVMGEQEAPKGEVVPAIEDAGEVDEEDMGLQVDTPEPTPSPPLKEED